MFELVDTLPQNAVIKVIGVGGGGGNAVRHMIGNKVEGVEFVCANTDAQALKGVDGATVLQLGSAVTKGLGAGANPEIGRQAAIEDRDRIADVLEGTDMVFITAGMGGGTGTGAAPIVASVAKEMGILTVAVVTKPFMFEGRKRLAIAEQGMRELQESVDSLITVPNEKLLKVLGADVSLISAFSKANDVLHGAVQGIADLIMRPGMINVDFADVRTVMSEMGMAMMGTGSSEGADRAREAAEKAVRSPLLEDVNLDGARGILVNVTAGPELTLGEFSAVGDTVEEFASDNATVVVGTVIDPELGGELRVTVVATGLGGAEEKAAPRIAAVKTPEPLATASNNTTATSANTASAAASVEPNYNDLDVPTVIRSRRAQGVLAEKQEQESAGDMEYLDIPAFLRRQAD